MYVILESAINTNHNQLPAGMESTTALPGVSFEPVGLSGDPSAPKEVITGQLEASFRGYQAVVEQINKNRNPEGRLEISDPVAVLEEFEAWFSEERQAYTQRVMEADPEVRFTLVIMPNAIISGEELVEDAEAFGAAQPCQPQIYPEILAEYTAEELSYDDGSDSHALKFVLVPDKLSPGLHGTADEQRHKLAELQLDYPFLEAPSPFIDMAYRHARRALVGQAAGPGTDEATHMRSFSMDPKSLEDADYVPVSFIGDDGQLMISYSRVLSEHDGRILVG